MGTNHQPAPDAPKVDGRKTSRRRAHTAVAAGTDELLADYQLSMQRRGVMASSVTTIMAKLWLLAEHAHPVGLLDLDAETIEQFLDARQLVPRSRYSYLSHFANFYRWAVIEGHANADPTLRIRRPKLPRHLPRPIADPDLTEALAQADDDMRAMLLLGAFSGLRAAEIGQLQRENLLDRNTPPVIVLAGKGGHERVLPLHPEVLGALRKRGLPRAGFLFNLPGCTTGLHGYAVSQRVNGYLHSLGLDATAHQLRHWFGTKTYQASRDLRLVQALMGHASPTTTAGYTMYAAEDAQATVRALRVDGFDR